LPHDTRCGLAVLLACRLSIFDALEMRWHSLQSDNASFRERQRISSNADSIIESRLGAEFESIHTAKLAAPSRAIRLDSPLRIINHMKLHLNFD
jgi:hypothetical protein